MHETGDAESARRGGVVRVHRSAGLRHGLGLRRAVVPPALRRDVPDAPHQAIRRGGGVRRAGRADPSARVGDRDSRLGGGVAGLRYGRHPQPRRTGRRGRGRAARRARVPALDAADRTGDLLDPFRIQAEAIHRGRTVDPFTGVANGAVRVLRPRPDRPAAPRGMGRRDDRAGRGRVPAAPCLVRVVRRRDRW